MYHLQDKKSRNVINEVSSPRQYMSPYRQPLTAIANKQHVTDGSPHVSVTIYDIIWLSMTSSISHRDEIRGANVRRLSLESHPCHPIVSHEQLLIFPGFLAGSSDQKHSFQAVQDTHS